MNGLRRLAADGGQHIRGDLPALGERHQQHGGVGVAGGGRDRGVVADGVDIRPATDAAEFITLHPSANDRHRQLSQQRIGADPDGDDDASGRDPFSIRERHRAGGGVREPDAQPQVDPTPSHPAHRAVCQPLLERRQDAGQDIDLDHPNFLCIDRRIEPQR